MTELARLDALLPLLLDIAVAAHAALDDCQVDGPDGPILDASTHALLCKVMERLDELPGEPGYASTGPAKARYALHNAYPALREQLREMAAEIAAEREAAGTAARICSELRSEVSYAEDRLAAVSAERDELKAKLNAPELHDFAQAVVLEAAHQRERWGNEHDEGKTAEDWMWLVAYLSTKATQAARYGDAEKYLHHIITCAAACNNWHASASGANNEMRAGAHVSITELDAARAASEGKP